MTAAPHKPRSLEEEARLIGVALGDFDNWPQLFPAGFEYVLEVLERVHAQATARVYARACTWCARGLRVHLWATDGALRHYAGPGMGPGQGWQYCAANALRTEAGA